jgi:hypothetical protein
MHISSARMMWVGACLLTFVGSVSGQKHDHQIGEDGTMLGRPWSGLTRYTEVLPTLGSTELDVAIVAAASADVLDDPFTDPQVKLLQSGLFGSITVINAGAETPTLEELKAFDAVLVWSNFDFANAEALGDVLADYVDASDGGGVVVAVFASSSDINGRYLEGRWRDEGYHVIAPEGGNQTGSATLGTIFDNGSVLVQNVATFSGGLSFRPLNSTLHPQAQLIADWDDGTPLIAARTDLPQQRVDLGMYPPSSDVLPVYWDTATDGDDMLVNALLFAVERYDVSVELVPVLAPSAVDAIDDLGTLTNLLPPGSCPDTYYLEVWVTDRGAVNTGVTGIYLDVIFNPSVIEVLDLSYSASFPFFPEGVIDNVSGVVTNFGATDFSAHGISPEWARVGALELSTIADTQTLFTSSLGVGGLGVFGRVPPPEAKIEFGVTLNTLPYGDVDRDGMVTLSDITCVADAFGGVIGPCQFADMDLAPCGGDGLINADDLLAVIDAFSGGPICCPE